MARCDRLFYSLLANGLWICDEPEEFPLRNAPSRGVVPRGMFHAYFDRRYQSRSRPLRRKRDHHPRPGLRFFRWLWQWRFSSERWDRKHLGREPELRPARQRGQGVGDRAGPAGFQLRRTELRHHFSPNQSSGMNYPRKTQRSRACYIDEPWMRIGENVLWSS
jgi:hypothetical protein